MIQMQSISVFLISAGVVSIAISLVLMANMYAAVKKSMQ